MKIKGWVYVISNKAMDGILKVGHSTKDPELRAQELNHTGSPHPYEVEYEILVEEPYRVEQAVHKTLYKYREGKEWFRCTPEQAILAIKQVSGDKLILENFKLADRKKSEELLHKQVELQRKEKELRFEKESQERQRTISREKERLEKEAQEKQIALVMEKEQQIINRHYKRIKNASSRTIFKRLFKGVSNDGEHLSTAYFNRGIEFAENGRNDRAFEDFKEAIKLNPNNVQAYYHRGLAYGNKGQYDLAISDLQKSCDLGYQKGCENLSEMINNRGIEFSSNGLYDRAIECFNKAISLNQKLAKAYYHRGLAYGNKGQYDLAISDFQKACDLGLQTGCENLQKALRLMQK